MAATFNGDIEALFRAINSSSYIAIVDSMQLPYLKHAVENSIVDILAAGKGTMLCIVLGSCVGLLSEPASADSARMVPRASALSSGNPAGQQQSGERGGRCRSRGRCVPVEPDTKYQPASGGRSPGGRGRRRRNRDPGSSQTYCTITRTTPTDHLCGEWLTMITITLQFSRAAQQLGMLPRAKK